MPTPPDPTKVFERTSCDCGKCQVPCHHMPGCLVPGDLERIAEYLGVEVTEEWVQNNFRASDGAKVFWERNFFEVPTIVPAQMPDGRCQFLTEDGKCSIHPVSPFGCAYHDMHIEEEQANRLSDACVKSQLHDALNLQPHSEMLKMLLQNGLKCPPLHFRRKRMAAAVKEYEDVHGEEEEVGTEADA